MYNFDGIGQALVAGFVSMGAAVGLAVSLVLTAVYGWAWWMILPPIAGGLAGGWLMRKAL